MENFAEDDLGGEDYKGRSIKESARKQELVTSYGKQTEELGYYMRGSGILHKLLEGICDGEGGRGRRQQRWWEIQRMGRDRGWATQMAGNTANGKGELQLEPKRGG